MNRTIILVVVAAALLVAACCCCGDDFGWDWGGFQPTVVFQTPLPLARGTATPESTAIPRPTLTPQVVPTISGSPAGDIGDETVRLLAETDIPVRDLHELAIRLRGLPPDTSRTINPGGSPDYPVGTRRLFHASNVDTDAQFDIYAILEYKTAHVYMWIEEGEQFDRDDLVVAADFFEKNTYTTNQAFFGAEWSPGVDNDPHVSILHARNLGWSVAGYYSSADEFVAPVREDSNEMEMFYISIENTTINDDFYNGVLAHEFQHMIHWYHDRNEETWLNEGFSELAVYLNDFDTGAHDWSFAKNPDTQLNSWPEGPGAAGANYGAGYLFTSYFLDRFGAEATQALVAHEENSLASVDAVLAELGAGITHEDLFADWVVANLLDKPSIDDGRYGYEDIDPSTDFDIESTYRERDFPVSEQTTVHQYATDYIELRGQEQLKFHFVGSTQVGLINTTAHSGDYVWWSNRGDDSNMMLTRSFDLSNVSEATLEFWTWYDIEEDWDYVYVEASTDGETWEILTTSSGTGTNPNGNSFGWAYTGKSGGGTPQWIQEQVDLSAYAGQEVWIRFEYITDDAVNCPGFVLDDVAIPEIGYSSDFEENEGGWEAEGFIRHANVLPQRWLVQLVLFGPEMTVQRLALAEDQTGEWNIPLNRQTDRAVITVSGLAPVTTEVASYAYEIVEGR